MTRVACRVGCVASACGACSRVHALLAFIACEGASACGVCEQRDALVVSRSFVCFGVRSGCSVTPFAVLVCGVVATSLLLLLL